MAEYLSAPDDGNTAGAKIVLSPSGPRRGGTGTKEQLVASPLEWPGPNAARALVHGEPVVGYWFNRTKEWKARRRGEDFQKYDYATRYEIELQPLPGSADLSPEAYRAMVAEVVSEVEEEAAAERGDRPVMGVEKILAQDACQRPRKTKKSPAPMLFFAERKETRDALANTYRDFVDEYELAADRLIQAALQGVGSIRRVTSRRGASRRP